MFDKRIDYGSNPVLRFMQKFGYLMALNVLFILFSLPVITAGAALCALYYTIFKIIEGKETEIFRTFVHGFIQNLVPGIVFGAGAVFFGRILFLELKFLLLMPLPLGRAAVCGLWTLFSLGLAVFLFIFLYLFPLQARFYNSMGGTLAAAFLMSFKNLPSTVVLAVTDAGAAAAAVWFYRTFSYIGIIPWMVLIPLICMTNALWMKELLKLKAEERREASEDINKEDEKAAGNMSE